MKYNRFTLLTKLFVAKISGESPVFSVFMKGKKVLDVGCGEGVLLKIDQKMVYGVDINMTLLAKIQAEGLQAKYSDATSLDFADNFFDIIHCSNIIEHLTPLEAYKMFKDFSQLEVCPVRGALGTWVRLSPMGRFKFIENLFYVFDIIFGKLNSRQVSGYNIFLVK